MAAAVKLAHFPSSSSFPVASLPARTAAASPSPSSSSHSLHDVSMAAWDHHHHQQQQQQQHHQAAPRVQDSMAAGHLDSSGGGDHGHQSYWGAPGADDVSAEPPLKLRRPATSSAPSSRLSSPPGSAFLGGGGGGGRPLRRVGFAAGSSRLDGGGGGGGGASRHARSMSFHGGDTPSLLDNDDARVESRHMRSMSYHEGDTPETFSRSRHPHHRQEGGGDTAADDDAAPLLGREGRLGGGFGLGLHIPDLVELMGGGGGDDAVELLLQQQQQQGGGSVVGPGFVQTPRGTLRRTSSCPPTGSHADAAAAALLESALMADFGQGQAQAQAEALRSLLLMAALQREAQAEEGGRQNQHSETAGGSGGSGDERGGCGYEGSLSGAVELSPRERQQLLELITSGGHGGGYERHQLQQPQQHHHHRLQQASGGPAGTFSRGGGGGGGGGAGEGSGAAGGLLSLPEVGGMAALGGLPRLEDAVDLQEGQLQAGGSGAGGGGGGGGEEGGPGVPKSAMLDKLEAASVQQMKLIANSHRAGLISLQEAALPLAAAEYNDARQQHHASMAHLDGRHHSSVGVAAPAVDMLLQSPPGGGGNPGHVGMLQDTEEGQLDRMFWSHSMQEPDELADQQGGGPQLSGGLSSGGGGGGGGTRAEEEPQVPPMIIEVADAGGMGPAGFAGSEVEDFDAFLDELDLGVMLPLDSSAATPTAVREGHLALPQRPLGGGDTNLRARVNDYRKLVSRGASILDWCGPVEHARAEAASSLLE
eukprot:jgi/Mesen1/9041/ME000057S08464